MKHIEYYEADDGTRFDDKWDCEAYETQKAFPNIDNYMRIFDDNFNKISIGAIDEDDWQNNAEYFVIYNEKTFDYLRLCENWSGLRLLRKPMNEVKYPLFLKYDTDNAFGINIREMWDKWNDLYNRLKEAI